MKRLITAILLLTLTAALRAQDIDFDALNESAQKHLVNLININTAQPEPEETKAARYIYKELNKHNIDWDIYRVEKARGNLIATLKGGKEKPLILIAHLDTAAVQDGWTIPPTKATVKDGRIWGLGSTDAKNYVATNLALLIWLKENKIKLNRDLIFVFTADEENGSNKGIKFLLDKYPQKLKAGFALNEGGGLILSNGANVPKNIMFVEAASKMYMDILLTAGGEGAHSAVPAGQNAIYKLSEALPVIEAYQSPLNLTPFTKTFFDKISELQDDDAKTTISLLDSPDTNQVMQAVKIISEDAFFKTQLTDTITPTLLAAGTESNTLSSQASATLNCRLLPTTNPSAFFKALQNLFANDDSINLTIIESPELPFPQPPAVNEDPLFKAIELSASQLFPNTITVAGMTPASTESEFLRRHGIISYGLGPVMDAESGGAHTTDESISREDFYNQLKLMLAILLNFAQESSENKILVPPTPLPEPPVIEEEPQQEQPAENQTELPLNEQDLPQQELLPAQTEVEQDDVQADSQTAQAVK